eukprot:GHRQ01028224.1.p2 GENE.GHRQ01028224.1~~GHRQ01028224.1.p2  ORF type:complete len:137 (-),score=19.31 GHRQ01028224.1:327-737(-)
MLLAAQRYKQQVTKYAHAGTHYGPTSHFSTKLKARELLYHLQKTFTGHMTCSSALLHLVPPAVEVSSQFKGADHALAVGHVCQQPQLQLPVVSHHQRVAGRSTEGLAHLQQRTRRALLSMNARGRKVQLALMNEGL